MEAKKPEDQEGGAADKKLYLDEPHRRYGLQKVRSVLFFHSFINELSIHNGAKALTHIFMNSELKLRKKLREKKLK